MKLSYSVLVETIKQLNYSTLKPKRDECDVCLCFVQKQKCVKLAIPKKKRFKETDSYRLPKYIYITLTYKI